MRLLLDENIGSTIATSLASSGHDVVRQSEIGCGADDVSVLARARAEDRILITYDSDHGELVFYRDLPPPPAILYLRLDPKNLGQAIERIGCALAASPLNGHIIVIEDNDLRYRAFPDGVPNG